MNNARLAILGVIVTVLSVADGARGEALDNCWAEMETTAALGECLTAVKDAADARMAAAYEAAMAEQRRVDEALGRNEATRTLNHAQRAFELYRDLHCRARELASPRDGGATDAFTGCWIDQTRARIAALEALAAEEPAMPTDDLTGVTWIVDSIAGEAAADGVESTLVVDQDGKIGGSGGCNRYFGEATITGKAVGIGPLGSTRRACPEPMMGQETRFMRTLQTVKTFRLDNGTLVMSDAEGTDILTFRAAE